MNLKIFTVTFGAWQASCVYVYRLLAVLDSYLLTSPEFVLNTTSIIWDNFTVSIFSNTFFAPLTPVITELLNYIYIHLIR